MKTESSDKKIEFIDLSAQQTLLHSDISAGINRVLKHGQYILGPEIQELEKKLAEFVGVKHALTVSSGTDALLIALMAHGVGVGDEVITTPFSFIATAEVISLLGAKPVFVDIEEKYYNLNPNLIEKAVTPKTKAVMPVSLYGQCANIEKISSVASRFNVPVIEDAAQSFGATRNGVKSCALTPIGCTSFFPSKPLGCYGDGGACFTNDDGLFNAMYQIHVHGQSRRYHHPVIGINGRFDTLQAAIMIPKLAIFPEEIKKREKVGMRYTKLLSDFVKTPEIEACNTHVFAQYTIEVDNRDRFHERLKQKGVPTAVHYPQPLHLQPVFRNLGYQEGDFPVAERAARRVVSLPMHPYLSEEDQDFIVNEIKKNIEGAPSKRTSA